MVVDGHSILDKSMVSIPDDGYQFDTEAQIQPNGIDLRVMAIAEINGKARIPRDGSVDFDEVRFQPLGWKDGIISVKEGRQYTVTFRESIAVRDGFCAIIVPRSSLLRSGALITSALWDTGFQGRLGGVIRPLNPLDIEFGSRLAQVIFHDAEFNGHRYEGRYQGTTSQTAFMTNG